MRLGEIGPGLPYRLTRLGMAWAYRRCRLVVALDEDMEAHLREQFGVPSRRMLPWPSAQAVRGIEEALATDSIPQRQDWTWLYSGNLGRAHEWEPLLEIQSYLEKKGLPATLVFQGDDAARSLAPGTRDGFGTRTVLLAGVCIRG